MYNGAASGASVDVVKDKVRPGDIIQYRDAFFETRTERTIRKMTAEHHTAIISWAGGDGSIWKIYEQKVNNDLRVRESVLPIGDLKSGWIRVYRALPSGTSIPLPLNSPS